MTPEETAIAMFREWFGPLARWGNQGPTEQARIIAAVKAGLPIERIFGPGAAKP